MTSPPPHTRELCQYARGREWKWLAIFGLWFATISGLAAAIDSSIFSASGSPLLANAWTEHHRLLVVSIAVVVQTALIAGLLIHRARWRKVAKSLRESEERYREVVESQNEMVCRYRHDTTLTFVNEAYCRFFGKSREELLGKKFIELVPPDSREAVHQMVEALAQSRQRRSTEHEVLLPNGQIGWHHWEDYPVIEISGGVEEFQGIGRDITERKITEDALRMSEKRMQLAAEAASLGYWEWDLAQDRVWMSEHRRSFLGLADKVPFTLAALFETVHPEDRAQVEETMRRVVTGQLQLDMEYRTVLPSGETRWTHVCGRCDLRHDATVQKVFGVSIDVTARKKAEEAMQNLIHAARLATIGELTASLAHEMNQPLGAILSNAEAAEILLESEDPPLDEIRQILADIRNDDLRACETMQRVRALSRKHESEKSTLDLNQVVSEVVPLVALDARRRRVSLKTNLASGLAPIRGNRIHLQQVLLNLVVNAFDAMDAVPEHQRHLEIETALSPVGEIEVSVTDHGPGISGSDLPRLCESFFTTKKNGLGLGLAIARTIIEAHHGRLSAENHAGGGARFRFTMPVNGH